MGRRRHIRLNGAPCRSAVNQATGLRSPRAFASATRSCSAAHEIGASSMSAASSVGLHLALVCGLAAPAGADNKSGLRPAPAQPVPPAELQAAITRGVAFLLKDQNRDGSWGSPHRTKGLNIYA